MTLRLQLRGPICMLIAGIATLPLSATAEVSRGQILASTCFACHGTDGKSPGAIPSIHGYPAEVLERQLKGFRDGTRAATVMNRHAKGYTDEDIKLLSEYLGSLK